MKEKINAYNKISRAIKSSRNELHLKTCSVMIGLFNMRYNDEHMKDFLKEELDDKRRKIKTSRFEDVLMVNH
jgi:hypothetical protein